VAAGRTCSEIVSAIDLLPTILGFAGKPPSPDITIDGKSLVPLLTGAGGVGGVHDAFYYYHKGALEAVRVGSWKLHLSRDESEVCELYDLDEDIGETASRAEEQPGRVADMRDRADTMRQDLGDRRLGIRGTGQRSVGRVANPAALTRYRPDCPYIISEYDLEDSG
jgi:arylsulfatase A